MESIRPIAKFTNDGYLKFYDKLLIETMSHSIKIDPDIGITRDGVPIDSGDIDLTEIVMSGSDRKIKMNAVDGLIFSVCPPETPGVCKENIFTYNGLWLDSASAVGIGDKTLSYALLAKLTAYFAGNGMALPGGSSISIGGATLTGPNITYITATVPTEFQLVNTRLDNHDNILGTLQGQVATIPTLRSDLDGVVARVSILEPKVTALETTVGTLGGSVTTLQGSVTTLQGDVGTLQGSVTTLQGNVTTLQGETSSLDSRVTAIENAGGSTPVVLPDYVKSTKLNFGAGKTQLDDTTLTLGAATFVEADASGAKTTTGRFSTFGSLAPTATSFPVHFDTSTGKLQWGTTSSTETQLPSWAKPAGPTFANGTALGTTGLHVGAGSGPYIEVLEGGIVANDSVESITLGFGDIKALDSVANPVVSATLAAGDEILVRTSAGSHKRVPRNAVTPSYVGATGLDFGSGAVVDSTAVSLWNTAAGIAANPTAATAAEVLPVAHYDTVAKKLKWRNSLLFEDVPVGKLALDGAGFAFTKAAAGSIPSFNLTIGNLEKLKAFLSRTAQASFSSTLQMVCIHPASGAYFNNPMPDYLKETGTTFGAGAGLVSLTSSGLTLGTSLLDATKLESLASKPTAVGSVTATHQPVVYDTVAKTLDYADRVKLFSGNYSNEMNSTGFVLRNSGAASLDDPAVVTFSRRDLADLQRFGSRPRVEGTIPQDALYPTLDPATGVYSDVTGNTILSSAGGFTFQDPGVSSLIANPSLIKAESSVGLATTLSPAGITFENGAESVLVNFAKAKNLASIPIATTVPTVFEFRMQDAGGLSYTWSSPGSMAWMKSNSISPSPTFNITPTSISSNRLTINTSPAATAVNTTIINDGYTIAGATRSVGITESAIWMVGPADGGATGSQAQIGYTSWTNLARYSGASLPLANKSYFTSRMIGTIGDAVHSYSDIPVPNTFAGLGDTRISLTNAGSIASALTLLGEAATPGYLNINGLYFGSVASDTISGTVYASTQARVGAPTSTHTITSREFFQIKSSATTLLELNKNGIYFGGALTTSLTATEIDRLKAVAGLHSTDLAMLTLKPPNFDTLNTMTELANDSLKFYNCAITSGTKGGLTGSLTPSQLYLTSVVSGGTTSVTLGSENNSFIYRTTPTGPFGDRVRIRSYDTGVLMGLNPLKFVAANESIYGPSNTTPQTKNSFLAVGGDVKYLKIISDSVRESVVIDFFFQPFNLNFAAKSAVVGFIVPTTVKPQYTVTVTIPESLSAHEFVCNGIEPYTMANTLYVNSTSAGLTQGQYWVVTAKLTANIGALTTVSFSGKVRFEYRGADV